MFLILKKIMLRVGSRRPLTSRYRIGAGPPLERNAATDEKRRQHESSDPRCGLMRDGAEHYRQRAAHCRELAESARDDLVIQRLMELAADFEEEADRLDGGDAKPV